MRSKTKVMATISAIFLLILMVMSCNKAPVDVTDQIKASNQVIMDAVLQADVNALTSLYTTDAKLFPANSEIIDGQNAIGEFWKATLGMGIKKVLFETEKAMQYGDIAIEEGLFTLFIEGDMAVDQGKYIVTWKRDNGIWKVFRDVWNSSSPLPTQRAKVNDKILIVLNHVKADKVAQFEDFYKTKLAPAGTAFNPQAKGTVRVQSPSGPNTDGTFTYVFLMDPYVDGLNYDINYPLEASYGPEKAREYMALYLDCLKGKVSEFYLQTETDW
ncbi:MAG: DUF4440 domain-containing protein [Bacteroidales bacterium]|nr:DUF4440 domain-containing protein [Bacteroidales bacterium]